MTPATVKSIRKSLGLTQNELGRWLMLSGEQPGHTVRMWEMGKRPVTGPVEVCLTAFAGGYVPGHIDGETVK
ncbi:helix-turn-helix domain-containing protein [Sphingomonas sp.]|uniref:helix-turn-helix domain-containing protein n=1 Tax=Sphingomonas sp. TaxID=28214 RepID=UPI003B3B7001